jgi:hypothetical protein
MNIKSVTLKNILFYNSWNKLDFLDPNIILLTKSILTSVNKIVSTFGDLGNLWETTGQNQIDENNTLGSIKSLGELCAHWQKLIKNVGVDHVKFYCDQNNFIFIELTEDKDFSLNTIITQEEKVELFYVGKSATEKKTTTKQMNKWFGFRQEKLTKKGKYYSTKPLNFYRTNLFLRCNLIAQQNTFYNNKPSNILCAFPVEDGEQIKLQRYEPLNQIKLQRYEPLNCTKIVNKSTNYLKFEITDEHGKIANFRGMPLLIHLTLEVFPKFYKLNEPRRI